MEEKKVIECVICGESDKWMNVDEYRRKPIGMCLCQNCGFVTYPDLLSKPEAIDEYYRHEYRKAPTAQAVFTGQRKLHYHNAFLSPLFKRWKQEGVNPKVFEIGGAIGLFLKCVRDHFPKADIAGSELNESNRKVAKYGYGVTLGTEFDASKKYDLIATYKVAEHIPEIQKHLRQYAECLTEHGFLYISVPTWFHSMTNFGVSGFDLEYYYHKNHINVWTQKLFETLLKKCGLEVVQKNDVFYDSTYLCKRNDAMMLEPRELENPVEILDKLDRIKRAALTYESGKPIEALEIFPTYPDAWINGYEMKRNDWHKKGFEALHEEFLKKAKEACPKLHVITMFCADICMRYQKFDLALRYLDEALKQKPCDAAALIAIASTYRQMAQLTQDQNEKMHFYNEAKEATKFLQQVSFEHSHQAMTWLFVDYSNLPLDAEIPKPVMQAVGQ